MRPYPTAGARMLFLVALLAAALVPSVASAQSAEPEPPPPPTQPPPPPAPDPPPVPPPVPVNDNFANALELSATTPQRVGNTWSATAEPGEPAHLHSARRSVWFTYTATSTRVVEIGTCGSTFDTVTAVYQGDEVSALAPVATESGIDCDYGADVVSFQAVAGQTYRIALDGWDGDGGQYRIALDPPPANDHQDDAAYIADGLVRSADTTRATAETGEPDHAGEPASRSVWFWLYVSHSRRVVFDTCGSGFPTVLAAYADGYGGLQELDSSSSQNCGPGTHGTRLTFSVPDGGHVLVALDGVDGASGRYRARVLTNDDRSGAAWTSPYGWPATGDSTWATAETGEAPHAGQPAAHSVWHKVSLVPGETMTVSSCGSEFATVLAAYHEQAGGLTELASSSVQSCGPGVHGTKLRVQASEYGTYLIAVDGLAGASGRYTLRALRPDDRAGAVALWRNATEHYDNTIATKEPGEADHAGNAGGHSMWFELEPWEFPAGSRVTVDTCSSFEGGPTVDTVLAAYSDSYGGLTEIASNDDTFGCGSGGTGSRVELIMPSWGGSVLIAVDGKNGATGQISIRTTAAPANDNRAGAQTIAPSQSTIHADNIGAGKEPGEPDHAGNAGGHSVWFSWTPSSTGPVTFDTCASSYSLDTLLAVYRETPDGLEPIAASDDAPGCLGGTSRVTFDAAAGTRYLIAVDGRHGDTGYFTLTRRSGPANDNFSTAQSLFSSAAGTTRMATAEPGEPGHAGSAATRSVWYRYEVQSWQPATLSVSTCNASSEPTRIAVYRGSSLGSLSAVASGTAGAAGCAGGDGARATWTRASLVQETYWVAVDVTTGADSDFTVTTETPPGNDHRSGAQWLFGDSSTSQGSTVLASHEPAEADHAGAGGTQSVWYRWMPSSTGMAQIHTCTTPTGVAADTILAVYEETATGLEPLASNDDTPGCRGGKGSRVALELESGSVYFIAVDSRDDEAGTFILRAAGRPYNDDRARALDLTPSPYDSEYGWLDSATAEPGEAAHAGAPATHSVWYRFTPSATGPLQIDTCNYYGGDVDTALAVYTEGYGGLVEVASDDDAGACGSPGASAVSFVADAGREYLIAVDARDGKVGEFTLRLSPRNDHFAGAASQTGSEFGRSVDLERASAETDEPAHAGSAATQSVWFDWVPPRSALATIDTCDYAWAAARIGVYAGTELTQLAEPAGLARSACPGGQGQRVRFPATAGTHYRVAVDRAAQGPTYTWIRARLAPVHDVFGAEQDLGTLHSSTTVSDSTVDAGRDPGEADHAGAGGERSLWYRFTAGRSATWRIDTCTATAFDSALALYRSEGSALVEVASSDDAAGCGDGTRSRIRAHLDAGTTYHLAVDGHAGAAGAFQVAIAPGPVNDDLAAATPISPGSWSGTTFDAGDQPGEPDHAGSGGDRSTWWRFDVSGTRNGSVRVCPTGGGALPVAVLYKPSKSSPGFADLTAAGSTTTAGGCRIVRFRGATGRHYVAVDGAAAGQETAYTLQLAIAPANDDRGFAQQVAGSGTVSGTTSAATREEGEPQHAGNAGAASVWYRWTPSYAGPAVIDVCGAAFDTLLAVYTEAAGGGLTEMASSDDAAGCGSGGSRVALSHVAPDTTYFIAVDGSDGDEGSFTLGFPPANDHLAAAASLFGQVDTRAGTTARATAQPGEPMHALTTAERSTWFRWTPAYSGRATFSTCLRSDAPSRLALYTGTSLDSLTPVAASAPVAGCAEGNGARVRTRVQAGTAYLFAVDSSVATEFTVMVALAPPNDDRADARLVTAPSIHTGSTDYATAEDDEPAHAGRAAAGSVWFRVTAESQGPLAVKTCGSSFATVLAVYEADGTPVAASDDGDDSCGSSSGRAGLTFDATQAKEYFIALDGIAGAAGAYELAVGSPPNDDVEDAEALDGTPASGVGTNEAATTQHGEPQLGHPNGARSIWWQWTAPETKSVEINTCGSSVYTALEVFTGSVASLTRVASSTFGTGCSSLSRLTLAATAGTTYRIRVSSYYASSTGPIRLQIAPPANDRFAGAQDLSGSSVDTTGSLVGASTEDGESYDGAGRTIWYRWTAPERGRLTLDTCGSATPALVGAYLGTTLTSLAAVQPEGAQQTCDPATPGRSTTVPVEAGTAYRIRLDGSSAAIGGVSLRLRLVVDDTPPESSLTDAPAARTKLDPLTFAFEANEASSFECALDAEAFAPCVSPVSRHGVPDGEHTFRVRATDAADNLELEPALAEFTVDRTPPSVTIDSAPPPVGRDRDVSIGFSSTESDATFECSLDGAAFDSCSSPVALTDLPESQHTFSVRALDDLANTSQPASAVFTVDTTPPVTSFSAGPPAVTADATAHLEFASNEGGSSYECRLGDDPFAACQSPQDLSGLGEGTHEFEVRATDAAGNVETVPAARAWRVDQTAPETTASAAPLQPVKSAPAITLGSTEDPPLFQCKVDAREYEACSTPFVADVSGDGEHILLVRAVDAAGNFDSTPQERRFILDTTAPTVQFDSGPQGTIGAGSATFTFHASEATSGFECAIASTFAACASPVTYNSIPEGPHTLRIRATDLAGNVGPEASRAFVVDRTPPDTELLTRPRDPTNALVPQVTFRAEQGATFACWLGDAAPQPCSSPYEMPGLGEGDHTVHVRATDAAGNVEPEPASHTFEIDRTPPDTEITFFPSGPVHDEAAFGFDSTEDGGFECTIGDEPWVGCSPAPGGFVAPLTGRPAGEHTFRVRAIDAAGNVDPTPATRQLTIVNEAPTASLEVTPDSGAANLEVEVAIGASDADGDRLDFEVDFGDGERVSGTFPVDGAFDHTYDAAGSYVVRLEVDDGFAPVVVTRAVTVVLPEPLKASAGDDLVAVAGEPVILDGGGSRPLAGITSRHWSFGDGQSAEGDVVQHTYATPGVYEARHTVGAGVQSDSDTALVRVVAPSPDFVDVTVRSGGLPLPGADVLVVLGDGRRVAAVSGQDGHARLRGLPDGETRVLAYKSGYMPRGGDVTVAQGRGAVEVELQAGELAKAEMSSRRLSLDEILDLGIDPDDPANQHVFEWTVNLDVDTPAGPSPVTFTGVAGAGGGAGGFIGGASGGSGGLTCRRLLCKGTVNNTALYLSYDEIVPGVPTLTSLVIPFRAKWLKEFFEVGMTIHNLAEPGFVLENGQASLELPAGLSLAPTARGERITVSYPDIPGGGQAHRTWIVRGDVEGSYAFGANYGATLEPFGRSVTLRGQMEDPLRVWGGSALQVVVDVDKQVRDTYPFNVRVGLKNVADVPVYNPSVELLKEGRHGYIEQPVQQREFAAREIPAGQTFWAGPFILVPEVTGEVDLRDSFIRKTGGDVDLVSTIVTHDRVPALEDTPVITGHRRPGGRVVLQYPRAAGASGEQVYATPDRLHDFDPAPRATQPLAAPGGGVQKVMLTAEDEPWLGVSSDVGGRPTLVHPIIDSSSLPMGGMKAEAPSTTACKVEQVALTFEDADVALTSWEYELGDGVWHAGGAIGTSPPAVTTATATLVLPAGNTAVNYRVRVHNSLGETKELEGKRSVCTTEYPKTTIDVSRMECETGIGVVTISTEADPATGSPVTGISYIVGARAVQTVGGATVTLDYGPTSQYRLRTGGEVIRAAARDASGSVGEVAVQGVCPDFVDAGQAPAAPTDAPATGSEGGAPPRPQPASQCKGAPGLTEDSAGLDAAIATDRFPVRITARCVFRWGAEKGTFVLTDGAVRVSGLDFEPADVTKGQGLRQFPGITHAIVVRIGQGNKVPRLHTLGTYALKFGNQTLMKVPQFEVEGRKFRHEINELAGADFKGLRPGRGARGSLDFSKDFVTVDVAFAADQLGDRFKGVELGVGARADYRNGFDLATGRVTVKGQIGEVINLDGLLTLRERNQQAVFGGNVKATFGAVAKKLAGISTDLSFSVVDGRLERAAAAVAKPLIPPRPIGTPLVLLNKLTLDLGYDAQGSNSSLSFGGRAGFTAGGLNVAGFGALALIDGEMGLLYSLNENSADAIRLEGQAKLLRGKVAGADAWAGELSGESTLRFSGFLDFQGRFTLQPSFLQNTLLEEVKLEGTMFGWLDTTGDKTLFSVAGDGQLTLPGNSVKGKTSVTTKGAGLCAEVKVAFFKQDLGATVLWDDPTNPTFGCGFETIKVTPSAAELFPAAGASRARGAQAGNVSQMSTDVPANTPAVGYIFTGANRMPDVTVTGPGLAFSTAAPPEDDRVLVFRSRGSRKVMVLIAGPQAGRYGFTSSVPVTEVARSFGLKPPKVRVNVKPTRGGRAKLTYAVTDLEGRKLRFMERGSGGARTIGAARGARGSFTYAPEAGTAGKRTIYAIYGRSDTVTEVGTYRYAGPPRAARPGAIKARIRRGALVVSIGRARGRVLAYRVKVRLDGRDQVRVLDPRRRTLTIPFVGRGQRVRISAVALNEVRKPSAARTVTLRAR